jgi:hypothetical protein
MPMLLVQSIEAEECVFIAMLPMTAFYRFTALLGHMEDTTDSQVPILRRDQ